MNHGIVKKYLRRIYETMYVDRAPFEDYACYFSWTKNLVSMVSDIIDET